MRRGLAAAAAAAVVALAFGVPVAWAAPGPNVTDASVAVAMSGGNANPPLLSGHFHVDDPAATVTVAVKMSWTGPDPDHHPKFNPQNVCPGAQCASDGNGNYDIAGFALPTATYNGPYHVDATATATNIIGQSNARTAGADFQVAVAPPDVTGVTATVNKDRIVVLSWDRDVTTPDVQAYYIWRKGPGDKDFGKQPISQTPQQSSGARVSAPDLTTQNKGGSYTYQVQSVRNGGDGNFSSIDYVGSDRTKSQSGTVTVPNPPPGATTVPPPKPSPNGAPPVVQGTPSGLSHNSTFSGGSGSGSSSATTPTSEAVTPDPGFVRGLPFAGSNPGDANSEGDNSAVAVTPGRHSSSGRGYLVPAAGAAVLVLGALHLRMFKKRLDEPPSNLTPVT